MNQKSMPKKNISSILKRPDLPVWALASVIICLIIVIGGIIAVKPSTSQESQSDIQKQLDRIESGIAALDRRIEAIEKKPDTDILWQDRMDRLEGSLLVKLNAVNDQIMNLNMRIDKLSSRSTVSRPATKKASVSKPQKTTTQQKKPAAPVVKTPSTHIVKPGETVYAISRKYNISVSKLRSLNKLTDQGTIYVGQKLKIK